RRGAVASPQIDEGAAERRSKEEEPPVDVGQGKRGTTPVGGGVHQGRAVGGSVALPQANALEDLIVSREEERPVDVPEGPRSLKVLCAAEGLDQSRPRLGSVCLPESVAVPSIEGAEEYSIIERHEAGGERASGTGIWKAPTVLTRRLVSVDVLEQ